MKASHLLASVAVLALAAPGVATAASLGVDFDPSAVGVVGGSGNTWTLGYAFTDVSATSVVGLGTWNVGIQSNIEVGLWDSTGNLLAQATINGTEAPVGNADWLFESITPVALTPGDQYFVGSYGVTNYSYLVNPITVAPQITFDHNAWAFSGLNFPNLQSGASGEHAFFGGNVQLSGVPEPSTWAMMGVGFAAAGLAAVRRRRREAVAA